MSAPLSGARQARPSWFRRLSAGATARQLSAFVVPGPDVARARGLDLEAAGLEIADTPRHASVLVLMGEVPEGLKKAAAVAYAQMPRPRAIFAIGVNDISPLPAPDVSISLGQETLAEGVAQLRRTFAENAFGVEVAEFDVEAVRTETEYICPMHPEVVRGESGSCPICGMDLVPREAAAGGMNHGDGNHGHMDHEGINHADMDHGNAGRDHESHGADEIQSGDGAGEHEATGHDGHVGMDHDAAEHRNDQTATQYTCPMHPEVESDVPGSCPKCGMDLVPREGNAKEAEAPDEYASGEARSHAGMEHEGTSESQGSHGSMNHGHTDHGEHQGHSDRSGDHTPHGGHDHMDHGKMGFMSMVEMTKDLPRSSDGLPMEWVDVPFGPLFPGLPAGLALTLTLDGDTVAETEVEPGIEGWATVETLAGPIDEVPDRLALLNRLSPESYRMLALRALEDAAGVAPDERVARARTGALEQERAASHLGWLASFAHLIGYPWLERRAGLLQLALLRATDADEVAWLAGEARSLRRRVQRTPLLRRKLAGVGGLPDGTDARGPVAKAAGLGSDARANEESYLRMGFEPVVRDGGDALSRLRVRLAEIEQSLDLAKEAGSVVLPDRAFDGAGGTPSGTGTGTVETPRGAATLRLTLEEGEVSRVELDTPSTRHMDLVGPACEQRELADALVGVASLDLSPWEVVR